MAIAEFTGLGPRDQEEQLTVREFLQLCDAIDQANEAARG